jgi:hypothetical protein
MDSNGWMNWTWIKDADRKGLRVERNALVKTKLLRSEDIRFLAGLDYGKILF